MNDPMQDRVQITEIRMGKLGAERGVVLRFMLKPLPGEPATALPPSTPALQLTPQQARHLLLLLGQSLELPGSDIPGGPTTTH